MILAGAHTVRTVRAAHAGQAAHTVGGGRTITLVLLAALACVVLGVTVRAWTRTRGASDFYTGGRSLTAPRNGLALTGAYLSAAPFLGVVGVIALSGYDGFVYSIGFLAAWVPVLLIAGLVRNAGRYTIADVLADRAGREPAVRVAAAISTVTVSVLFVISELVAVGTLAGPLLGVRPGSRHLGMSAGTAEAVVIAAAGVLVIICVVAGGMKGTTGVQIVKTALLMSGAFVMTLLVLVRVGADPGRLLGAAARASGHGHAYPAPGLSFGAHAAGHARTPYAGLDLVSLALALVLGTAGLPHVLTRFSTVPDARAARRSATWAIGLVGAFCLMTLALGLGAAALVGRDRIAASGPEGGAAVPLLARELGRHVAGPTGGDVMLAVVAVAAFATVLAVAAGAVMAASTSLAHDCFGRVMMFGRPREGQEIAVARFAALAVGTVAVLLAVLARNLDVAFLVTLAFAIAASANLPAIVCALFWRRFNTAGMVAGIYGGLAASILLVIFSPVVSGTVDPATGHSLSLLPRGVDFHWFPLENPGLVSIPLGFLCAVAGTLLSREKSDRNRFAELTVRSLTGAGAHPPARPRPGKRPVITQTFRRPGWRRSG